MERNRNGVGMIIDKSLRDEVVDVKRKGDRIILIKLVLGEETINVISAYAPQIGLNYSVKRQFWDDMNEVVQGIPHGEKLFIGGDLNGHGGRTNGGFERDHGGLGFGNKNEAGEDILGFAVAYDLMLTNIFFKKRDSHLITFSSRNNCSQIDFILTRRENKVACKVTPGECLVTQHRLVVLDICIKRWKRKDRDVRHPRTRWWDLKGEKLKMFKDRLLKEGPWSLDEETNIMWSGMPSYIKKVAREVLGESRGSGPPSKDTWWQNEEVQKAIMSKRECYKCFHKCKNEENIEKYKLARKEAKKAEREARGKDLILGNCWLPWGPEHEPVRYWPQQFFQICLAMNISTIGRGGHSYTPPGSPLPMKGNGHSGKEDYGKACYIRNVKVLKFQDYYMPYPNHTVADGEKCYPLYITSTCPEWLFYFGSVKICQIRQLDYLGVD
ncbi:uncharacterized protein LOC143857020 [Tasmannia lanceolata]|uniref:uncharacterized protein LOC143857020 n=1 Tax=Tasmannia lanceolata TaxID=3420 RepID=UPI004063E440